MMRIHQVGDDAVRLRFIPFALKDLAKKWLFCLAVGSITSWDDFVKAFLKNSTLSTKPLSLGRISYSSSKNLVNRFGGILNVSTVMEVLWMFQGPPCLMSSSWHRKVATMLNSLRHFRLPNQDLLRNHVPKGILAKRWTPRVGFIWGSSWENHSMGTNSWKV